MAITCLIKPLADKLKKALKERSIDLAGLFDMSAEQIRAEFGKILPEESAKFVATEFEKAMVSQRKEALADFIEKTTKEETVKEYDLIKKVDDLKEKELLDPKKFNGLLEDLISDKLGMRLSESEITKLVELVDDLKAVKEQNKGKDIFTQYENEFNAITKINEYIASLNPSANAKILLGTIRRGAGLLASFKSPIVNIVSNTFWGTIGIAERRLKTLQIQGYNGKESAQLAWKAWNLYRKTGYDISRMISIGEDLSLRGEKIVSSQGKGIIRAYGRVVERYIFNPLYQAPDVAYSIFAFTDTARLVSSKLGIKSNQTLEENKKRSLEIMEDAFLVEPKTDEGKLVRQLSMSAAFYYTYTNNSAYSDFALKTRELINKIGDIDLGEALLPFMKTPANVQAAGLQLSGLAGFEAIKNTYEGYQEIKKGTGTGKEKFDLAIRSAVQLGLSIFISAIVLGMIKDDEYMPDYFTATDDERDFAKQNNIPFNSVRIGNKYVSFDYFGPIATPVKGALHARKYGKQGGNLFIEYGKGVGIQLLSFPGVSDIAEWLDKSKQALSSEDKKDYIKKQFVNGVINFVWTTFIPSVVSDLAIAFDEYQRNPENEIETIMGKIPFLRQQLDIKTNTFGDKIKTEGFLMSMLSGSRVKTPLVDPVFNELQNLLDTGFYPNVKDITKSNQKVKLLKEKISEEKFNKMMDEFGREFRTKIEQEFKSNSYQKQTGEEKKKIIEDIKNNTISDIVVKYGYNRLRKQSK